MGHRNRFKYLNRRKAPWWRTVLGLSDPRSRVPCGIGSRHSAEQWEGRGDDRECNRETAAHCCPIGDPWNFERYVDLRAEVEGCSNQAHDERYPGNDEERQCTFKRNDSTKSAKRETGE